MWLGPENFIRSWKWTNGLSSGRRRRVLSLFLYLLPCLSPFGPAALGSPLPGGPCFSPASVCAWTCSLSGCHSLRWRGHPPVSLLGVLTPGPPAFYSRLVLDQGDNIQMVRCFLSICHRASGSQCSSWDSRNPRDTCKAAGVSRPYFVWKVTPELSSASQSSSYLNPKQSKLNTLRQDRRKGYRMRQDGNSACG